MPVTAACTSEADALFEPDRAGWADPATIDTAEYLHNDNIAGVALQYSSLFSPLPLLVEPTTACKLPEPSLPKSRLLDEPAVRPPA